MSNRWHLVVWPEEDGQLTAFMRQLTLTHAQRWKHAHNEVGQGHLYQGRFKSFPVPSALFSSFCIRNSAFIRGFGFRHF